MEGRTKAKRAGMNQRTTHIGAVLAFGLIAASAALSAADEPQAVATNPLREADYGDLHLHTSYSLDVYLGGAMRVDPDTAMGPGSLLVGVRSGRRRS